MAAFTAPWSGLSSNITRQEMPAANREIAIGMKTTSLKAADQLTRSVSTAKISPSAVTSAGTTATQMRLLVTDFSSVSLLKISV
jgi:hypothetical protein